MRSSTKLILLTLSTIAFVTESRSTIPSEEEKKELEKLLNHINKPAIKSFQTKHGYILDCIDIQKQLAFDHPLLKNHSIQLKPTYIPKWTSDNTTSQKSSSLPFQQNANISCPLGTVIIKRTTLEDLIQIQHLKTLGFNYRTSKDKRFDITGHHYALAEYYEENFGAMGNINVWDPYVKPDQFSLASISIGGGDKDTLQSISAGWIVSPNLNQHHSGLFIYWTASGYNETGCFNILCPGFVQVSSKFALGDLANPVSTYDGQQYHLIVSIFQDRVTRDWWFMLRDEPIGYLPRSLFDVNGLANKADRVYWGGEVFSAAKRRTSPIMGSGYFAQAGFKKAAFVNGLKVIDRISRKVTSPPISALIPFANSPNCYNIETKTGDGDWYRYIFYGGPEGCTIK
ncbi:Protein neprosin [Cardamine amara subsp. amara]|uniref:Protein neprosin n=1 Tax=Cardamine amara subsp. amara TaxID=228776 RepID=A0ABD1A4D5_CARAN